MTQFIRVIAATSAIHGAVGRPDAENFTGTPDLRPMPHDGWVYYAWQGKVDFGAAKSPTCIYLWDGAAPAWVDIGTMEEKRITKGAQINADWILADASAFVYEGDEFRAGPDDIVRLNSINGYISLMNEMPPDWIGVWKTMADTYIALPNVAAWKPFYTAFVMKGVTNYLVAQELKARLAAATTAAEIALINWPEKD